jgi:glycerol-3-phosphate dehydrogenase
MASLSAHARSKNIQTLKDQTFDLLVIGGGITGAGVARDAASRGMKVALVETRDFAWATSSRSSKLVHGGIRYLEQYEFGLVFEALSERQRLFEIAPHLVHPLKFAIPLYKSGRVRPWLMKLGMMLYDFLSLYDAPELHASYSAKELLQDYPLLQSEELLGGFTYYDAYMDDDRLVHETLRSAARFGAVAVNFVRAENSLWKDGRIHAVEVQDLKSQAGRWPLRARHVVSCVGPWTDALGSSLLPQWKPMMRPSKGVHLTFERGRLDLKEAVVMAAEKRIVFAIPRHEMTIIGTTDTDFTEDPSQVTTRPEDVDYLLRVAQKYFPGANLTKSDIVASYAGVRPLVHDQAQTESGTSREHVILQDERGITFVAGGKYTTYRHMAEQAVKKVLSAWSFEDQMKYARGRTLEPLNPKCSPELCLRARREAEYWIKEGRGPLKLFGLSRLAERHGMEFPDIVKRYQQELTESAGEEQKLMELELLHAVNETMCLTLEDFYFRRVPLFLAKKDHGLPLLESLSRMMARQLGWSEEERAGQVNALQKQIRHELSWRD